LKASHPSVPSFSCIIMSCQTIIVDLAIPKTLPFLSRPPPPKKRPAPSQPLPRLPSSPATFTLPAFTITPRGLRSGSSTIFAWASSVKPGTPDAPSPELSPPPARSPRRRPSRRGSITNVRVSSASFINFEAKPSAGRHPKSSSSFKLSFVPRPMPTSPLSAALPSKPYGAEDKATATALFSPTSAWPKTSFASRFASVLRLKRRRGAPASAAPASPSAPHRNPRRKAQPKPYQTTTLGVAAELLAFGGGGALADTAQRLLAAEAEAGGGGAGVPFRDARGAWWRDAAEPWEHARLCDGRIAYDPAKPEWLRFDGSDEEATSASDDAHGLSAGSLSPCTAGAPPLCPASPLTLLLGALDFDLDVLPDSPVLPLQPARLAAPAPVPAHAALLVRPVRAGRAHLRQPSYVAADAADLAFIPRTPSTPSSGVRTPRSARFCTSARPSLRKRRGTGQNQGRQRRPAPLALALPQLPACAIVTPDPAMEFLAASFAPVPSPTVSLDRSAI
jgi:hypothetical protein